MIIPKQIINTIRLNFKRIIKSNKALQEKLWEEILNLVKYVKAEKNSIEISPTVKRKIYARLNEKFNLTIPDDASFLTVLSGLKNSYDRFIIDNERLDNMIASISTTGFKRTTYLLPVMFFCSFGTGIEFIYLLISGIKINALTKKDDDPLVDDFERKLLAYERKLGEYIAEDESGNLKIDLADVEDFSEVLYHYIIELYENKEFLFNSDESWNRESFITLLSSSIINYIIYCNSGYKLTTEELDRCVDVYTSLQNKEEDFAEAIRITCETSLPIYMEKQKKLTNDKKPSEKIQTKPETLKEYIADGHVVKICDENTLRNLLLRERISGNERLHYLHLMKGMYRFTIEDVHHRKLMKYRESLFTETQKRLYETAPRSGITSYIIDNAHQRIDETVEFLVEEVHPLLLSAQEKLNIDAGASCEEIYRTAHSSEDTEDIIECIDTAVAMAKEELETWFAIIGKNCTPEELKERRHIIYYDTFVTTAADETVLIPRFYESILAYDKTTYSSIMMNLKDILDGRLDEDKEITKKMPRPVYVKGSDYKIFYTFIDDFLIILDVLSSEKGEYRKIASLMNSDDFKDFELYLSDIESSNSPSVPEYYTSIIMTELDHSGKRLSLN